MAVGARGLEVIFRLPAFLEDSSGLKQSAAEHVAAPASPSCTRSRGAWRWPFLQLAGQLLTRRSAWSFFTTLELAYGVAGVSLTIAARRNLT